MNHRYLIAIVFMACIAGSCRKETPGTVIARVGSATLTLEESLLRIDTTRGSRSQQLYAAASQWIDGELLYQEAKRRGIEQSQEFRIQSENVKKQLAEQLFLNQYLYADSQAIPEQQLRDYFHAHEREFLLREDMVKLNIAVFSNRERASTFAATVARGKSWSESLSMIHPDTSLNRSSMTAAQAQYYSQHTLYPTELWKATSALGVGEVSYPIKTSFGYVILEPLTFARQGKLAEYDMAQDEVRQRFMIERRRKQYSELLGTLRKQNSVELLLEVPSSSDTTSPVNE